MSTNDLPTDTEIRGYASKGGADLARPGWGRAVWFAQDAVAVMDALAAMTPGNDVYDALAALPNADEVIADTTAAMRATIEGHRATIAAEIAEVDRVRAEVEATLPPAEYRCSRCGGHGVYGHHGACFRCGGEGIDPRRADAARRNGVRPVAPRGGYGEADEALS